jgi:amino acid transporter
VVLATSRAFEIAFILFVTWVILRYIMTEREVTTDTVYGAVCAYILIGLVFAIAYGLLEMFEPGSFRGITTTDPQLNWDFTYFSLVTMTTLGYGDITPVHELARSMATLQAITGQFYVAVLVARIVAIMSSKPSTP